MPDYKPLKVKQLRDTLARTRARWFVKETLGDDDTVPLHPLGGRIEVTRRAEETPRLDLRRILIDPPSNPMLLQRRIAHSILEVAKPRFAQGYLAAPTAPIAGVRPSSVDWRTRWGGAWITTVQDQNPCESCWAFCATAVVESMARIEHCVWSKRSEGDVHDGIGGKRCADGGDPAAALNWITANGICDPACYPYKTDDSPYNPTPDRPGRTVKIPDHVEIGDIEQQKVWLDTVGPLGVTFAVYHDFDAPPLGVFHHVDSPDHYFRGYHCVAIVGYDDNLQAWLMKNSWGPDWGDHGYVWIAYGDSDVDTWAKLGVHNVNPDPWTKRRLHNGNMIESGNGATHRNFEVVATANGSQVRHWWRQGGEGGDFSWHQGSIFGNDAAVCPTLTGTTYNRNFELVYMTVGQRLHHWFLDQATGQWNDGGVFGPTDVWGVPGFIQSNFGAPGNFEVVVRTADGKLNHWWRMNGPPWTWSDAGRFAANVAFSGPTLVQSNYGAQGNFELVCVLITGEMQHFWRDNDAGVWNAGVSFGSRIASPPCMIQGQYGAQDERAIGNFELCVAAGGQVEHWWRDNQGDMQWRQSDQFGHDVQSVAALLEGSFGFNLELIVLRTDSQLQHYWRDGAGWHEGVIIGPA
jgi:hypothetical protein